MIDFVLLGWLSKAGASGFLSASELGLLVASLIVVIGLIGEGRQSPRWARWHRLFAALVIVGVAGEMISDGGIFAASARLQEIQDSELTQARTTAAAAISDAEQLRRDNLELELGA